MERYSNNLKEQSLDVLKKLEKTYEKLRFRSKPDFNSYINNMNMLFRTSSMGLENTTTKYGSIFHFIHLRTTRHPEVVFCDELFKPKKNMDTLGKQLKYSSLFVSNILFLNIENILQTLNNEMLNYKLVPVRWSQDDNGKTKVIFLNIPRGEFIYFGNKAQHIQPYSKQWIERLIKFPRIYFKLGYKKFHLSRNGKTMYDNQSSLPVVIKNKRLAECFRLFMVQKFMSALRKKIVKPNENHQFWTAMCNLKEDEFWYFADRSSSKWAE